MAFTGTAGSGDDIIYVDKKRHIWWINFLGPFVILSSFWLYFAFDNNPLATLIPLIYSYGFLPLMDAIIGEDTHNPPEEVVADMALDNYYRWHLHARIPLHFLIFFVAVWFIGTQTLPWWSYVALVFGIGLASGSILLLTHELGHKSNKFDRFSASMGNALIGYGHFCIEHNQGHHVMVSTPEDPASSRMGENIYRFAVREISGTFVRGWAFERKRLARLGHGFWHWRNEILQSNAVSLALIAGCVYAFGPLILLFIIPHHMFGWTILTQANYVEHYGLMRQKLPNGKYERTQPIHSWNTNHLFSNILSFHLQRHSDHHAHPLRPYQVLRDFPDLPSLPTGYTGCYAMAMIPPIWYKVMDPKLMEWAGGDIRKVNIDPKKKDQLFQKYAAVA